MKTAEDLVLLEAILCTLVVRAGGKPTLPAVEVRDCGHALRLRLRADWQRRAVMLAVESWPLRARRGRAPRPRRHW
jgi:hypothetical protein